ncbi:Deoxyribonuclease-2-alpha, partial [Camponotus floridanus]
YVLYKLPKVSQSSNPLIRSGLAYLYITSETINKANGGWQLSTKKISDKNSIPGNTLSPLYNDTEAMKAFWILYNDDPPNRPSNGKYGHTKGAVVANMQQGFWLIHSVPNYPPVPSSGNDIRHKRGQDVQKNPAPGNRSEYDYPSSGKNYGQSFLCISVNGDQFNLIGQQLIYREILVYRKNTPSPFAQSYSVLTDAANQKRIRKAPFSSKLILKSFNNITFTSFAKSDKWPHDLYDKFVAPTLQSNLLTETWLNGRGKLPSDCERIKVYNIKSILIPVQEFNIEFKSSHDHSKWAVATENKANQTWICIGDINRADTQYHRGGGTVCFNHPKVWKNYRYIVNDVELCPKQYSAILA